MQVIQRINLLLLAIAAIGKADFAPKFIDEPKDQMVPIGKTIQLTCVMNFLPQYVIWYKDGQMYVTRDDFGDKDVYQYSVSLLLTPEEEDNNSHYKCQVFYGNEENEYIISREAKISVISKSEKRLPALSSDTNSLDKTPSFLEQPLNQVSVPGQKIEIKCVVNFRPKFVTWFRNNKTYMTQDNFGKGRVYMYSVSLLVKIDKNDNNNEYNCQVWYGDKPDDFIKSRTVVVTVKDEGYNLSEFDVTRPVSSISSSVKTEPKDKIMASSQKVVEPDDYYDEIDTSTSSQVNTAPTPAMQVNPTSTKPQFVEEPQDLTIKSDENLEMKCVVNFRPVKVIWFENHRKILIRNDLGTGDVNKFTVSLFLTPDLTDNGNIYRCQVFYGPNDQQSIVSEGGKLTVLAADSSTSLSGPSSKVLTDESSSNNSSKMITTTPLSTLTSMKSTIKNTAINQPNFLFEPHDEILSSTEKINIKCVVNFRPKHVIWYLNNKKYTELNNFGKGPASKFTINVLVQGENKAEKREFRCQVWYGDAEEEYIMSRTAVMTFTSSNKETSSDSPLSSTPVATSPMLTSSTKLLVTSSPLPTTMPSIIADDYENPSPKFLSEPPSTVSPSPVNNGVEIQCVVNFRPKKVIWKENDNIILTRDNFGEGKAYKFSVTLRLSPEDEDSGNIYKCQVFYGYHDDDFITSKGVTLFIPEAEAHKSTPLPNKFGDDSANENLQEPKFVQEQSDRLVIKGQKVELNWAVNFVPTKVEWLKDGKVYTTMNSFEDVDYEYVLSYSVILQLPSATSKQTGNYKCKVWFGSGKDDFILSKTTKVTVS